MTRGNTDGWDHLQCNLAKYEPRFERFETSHVKIYILSALELEDFVFSVKLQFKALSLQG